jgi:O-antigen chain-terminating methyltransferase
VGTNRFYLDPTHQRPLPPKLLSFLPEYYGFARVKVIRLQESIELLQADTVSLNDVLGGVSPDYAVVAQKPADGALMTATGHAFEAEYGLTFETLVARFDRQLAGRAEETARLSQALEAARAEAASLGATFAQATSAWERASSALAGEIAIKNAAIAAREAELADEIAIKNAAIAAREAELAGEIAIKNAAMAAREAEIAELKASEAALRAKAEQLASALALATSTLQAVYASRSWKITLPYRGIGWAARGVVAAPKRIARICLERLPRWLDGRPHWKARALRMLRLVPPLERRLVTFARPRGHGSANLPAAIPPTWGIDPHPNALTQWRNIIESNRQPNTA